MAPRFEEQQRDVLCKAFNASVGDAAIVMSKLLGEGVQLSIPRLSILPAEEAAYHLGSANASLYSIHQPFKGAFHGDAFFVFPGSKSLDIVRKSAGQLLAAHEITSMEQDVMTVVGHIVLSACMSTLGETVGKKFVCGMLSLEQGDGQKILGTKDQKDWTMFLRTRFTLQDSQVDSFVVLAISATSLGLLRAAADRLIESSSSTSH